MDKIDIRDLILRTLKENEAGLIDQNNYVKAVKNDYYLQVAESVVENLPIYVVMQQRELLLAFLEFYHNPKYNTVNSTFAEDVEMFLAIYSA